MKRVPSQHPIALILDDIDRAANRTRGLTIEPFERDYLLARCDDLRRAIAVCTRHA